MQKEDFNSKMARKLEKEREQKRQKRAMLERRKEIESEYGQPVRKVVSGDVLKYCVRGIYILYRGSDVVYVGMSTDNCMKRICDHYREATKQFDTFSIESHENLSDAQLLAKERLLIKKYRPCFNKAHNTVREARSIYTVAV